VDDKRRTAVKPGACSLSGGAATTDMALKAAKTSWRAASPAHSVCASCYCIAATSAGMAFRVEALNNALRAWQARAKGAQRYLGMDDIAWAWANMA
jgi:hypothetical protein